MPEKIEFKESPSLDFGGNKYLGIPGEFLTIADKNTGELIPVRLYGDDVRIGFHSIEDDTMFNNFFRNDYGWPYMQETGGTRSVSILSRNHCVISREGGKRYVKDLGSRTGTYLNGERISAQREKGKRALRSNDIIGLIPHKGDLIIQIKYSLRGDWNEQGKRIFLEHLEDTALWYEDIDEGALAKDILLNPDKYKDVIEPALRTCYRMSLYSR